MAVRWKSSGSPVGVWWEYTGSLLRLDSGGSLLEVHWESTGSPLGVCWSQLWSLLGVRWELSESPLGV